MLRSMYSAISGMDSFQTKLDVIGNNIANVDTTGFKAGRTDFASVLSQTMSGGSQPTSFSGGTNPQQVGLGVQVAAIPTLFTQGASQSTGVQTDAMINGNGFFVVSPDGVNKFLTRAGDFTLDSSQNLVLPNGSIAQGFGFTGTQKVTGGAANVPKVDTTTLGNVSLPSMLNNYMADLNTTTDASGVTYTSNGTGSGSTYTASYSSGGATINRTFTLPSSPDLQIGSDGSVSVMLDYTDKNGTAVVGTGSVRATIGTLAIATVPNPGGLESQGNNMYSVANDSGTPTYQVAGNNNSGSIQSGFLEMSNVDLTREFTEMIVAQQGFGANSKMIGTDNTILNDILTMKNG